MMNDTERIIQAGFEDNMARWDKEDQEDFDREIVDRMVAIYLTSLKNAGVVVVEDEVSA